MTYENKSGGNVLMGNITPYKIVRISSIQIRMHDRIVRTITNVCHVLELKKNLISAGATNSKGFYLLC